MTPRFKPLRLPSFPLWSLLITGIAACSPPVCGEGDDQCTPVDCEAIDASGTPTCELGTTPTPEGSGTPAAETPAGDGTSAPTAAPGDDDASSSSGDDDASPAKGDDDMSVPAGDDDSTCAASWYPDGDGDGFGSAPSIVACDAPSGYVILGGDCDDSDASINPAAAERCNGTDDDCDGAVDDGLEDGTTTWFRDADGDGFGLSATATRCSPGEGFCQARGDCDDADQATHPGAHDVAGDEIDADCGGTDGPDPHVGLSDESLPSIQVALALAADGNTVWVGPGSYLEHDLDFPSGSMSLISTHLAGQTTIDAQGKGRVVRFMGSVGADTLLDGFTLTGGLVRGGNGGGIYVAQASPTIAGCLIRGNVAQATGVSQSTESGGDGGGLYATGADIKLIDCAFVGNTAQPGSYPNCGGGECTYSTFGGSGGGMALQESNVTIIGSSFSGNEGEAGGAVASLGGSFVATGTSIQENKADSGAGILASGQADLEDCELTGNAGIQGGGLLVYGVATVSRCRLEHNTGSKGAGLLVQGGTATLSHCVLSGNKGTSSGGGISANSAMVKADNVVITGNQASAGGGVWSYTSTISLTHCRIDGNIASGDGGGIALSASYPTLTSCILSSNAASRGGGIFARGSDAAITNCAITGNTASDGSSGAFLGASNTYSIVSSVFAYNSSYGLYVDPHPTGLTLLACDLYNPSGGNGSNLTAIDPSNLEVEPGFLAYTDGLPSNFHLAMTSPLIDAGYPSDWDGSGSDIGVYGGWEGDGFDLDDDGFPDYYWPGSFSDVPAGVDAEEWDCDDGDAGVQGCP